MAQQKEAISTINNLIETLMDGEKGFKEAADAVKDPQLKSLFQQYSQQRHRFASELQAQAQSLGESKPEKSSSATGAMHRAWINLKSAVTSGNDKAILAECERGRISRCMSMRNPFKTDSQERPAKSLLASSLKSKARTIAYAISGIQQRKADR